MRGIIALILGFFFSSFAYAQTDKNEVITISTFYPAPYGDYKQVEVKRGLRFSPVDTVNLTGAQPGELAYDNDKSFHYYSGSNWLALSDSGGSGSVITVSCPWHSDYSNATPKWGDGSQCGTDGLSCCVPPACPAGWTSLATYPELVSMSCPQNMAICYWHYSGGSTKSNHPVAVGNVVRVCGKN